MGIKRKIEHITQCNTKLDKKALCIKRSWDEVSKLLNTLCGCKENKKKRH